MHTTTNVFAKTSSFNKLMLSQVGSESEDKDQEKTKKGKER